MLNKMRNSIITLCACLVLAGHTALASPSSQWATDVTDYASGCNPPRTFMVQYSSSFAQNLHLGACYASKPHACTAAIFFSNSSSGSSVLLLLLLTSA
jgi:hypothetical protein